MSQLVQNILDEIKGFYICLSSFKQINTMHKSCNFSTAWKRVLYQSYDCVKIIKLPVLFLWFTKTLLKCSILFFLNPLEFIFWTSLQEIKNNPVSILSGSLNHVFMQNNCINKWCKNISINVFFLYKFQICDMHRWCHCRYSCNDYRFIATTYALIMIFFFQPFLP